MRIDIFDQAVELAVNRSIVLHDARAAEVFCTRGRIWITEDPLRNDIVLDAGKSHVIQVDGLAFVTGIAPSTVWLREPLQAPAGRRPTKPAGLLAAIVDVVHRMLGSRRRAEAAQGAPA